MAGVIPALWCIDVEPDRTEPSPGDDAWTGFVDAVRLADDVSARLEARTGRPVRVTWTFRMDPAIEQVYGRPDHIVAAYPQVIDRIRERGDATGVHIHPYRWDSGLGRWYTDHVDVAWTRRCFEVATGAYADAFGKPPRILRMGGYFLSDAVLDLAVEHGFEVDVSAEPGRPPVDDDPATHAAYANAPSTDFRSFPRERHQPGRPILLIPLSSTDYRRRLQRGPRAMVRRIVRRERRPLPLSPWRKWPSVDTYWNLMSAAVRELAEPHVAFALRTLPSGDRGAHNQELVLRGLPEHRIARRLQFVDPTTLVPNA